MDKDYLRRIGVENERLNSDVELVSIQESILKTYNEKCPHHTLNQEEFACAVKWAKFLIKWDFEQKQSTDSAP